MALQVSNGSTSRNRLADGDGRNNPASWRWPRDKSSFRAQNPRGFPAVTPGQLKKSAFDPLTDKFVVPYSATLALFKREC
jgi:hypothetical protein